MRIFDGRNSFYQWDINQTITSSELAEGDEVHFYNMTLKRALVVKAYAKNGVIVADVPNILLQEALAIKAYRYVTIGDSRHTLEEYSFPVVARAIPDDYIYTETEILSYEALDKRITKLEENGGGGSGGGSGEDGATFTPSVSPEGVISWTNDKGLDNPESVDMVQAVLSALPDNREVAY